MRQSVLYMKQTTDDGSNDNIFWQIFDELQSQSPDKKTVNVYNSKPGISFTAN